MITTDTIFGALGSPDLSNNRETAFAPLWLTVQSLLLPPVNTSTTSFTYLPVQMVNAVVNSS